MTNNSDSMNYKEQLLEKERQKLVSVHKTLKKEIQQHEKYFNVELKDLARVAGEDHDLYVKLFQLGAFRRDEFDAIEESAYFTRLLIQFENEEEPEEFYFGKFGLTQERLYAWVTPVARLRFEELGEISYANRKGKIRKGKLLEKDKFHIVKDGIQFYSHENKESGRQLIYQENFERKKKGFMLPEVVAKMEKNQDEVLRLAPRGTLTISGPAGSGKTTLALHRIAYLKSSPDTAPVYAKAPTLVLVQDESARKYFSHLLPSLGIKDVEIHSLGSWLQDILGLTQYRFVDRYGETINEIDEYEFQKLSVIQRVSSLEITYNDKNIYALLEKAYSDIIDVEMFKKQREQNIIDNTDITLLALLYEKEFGKLQKKRISYKARGKKKSGLARAVEVKEDISYHMILVDEFENYTPAQMNLFSSVLDKEHGSLVYVGDINQQSRIGSVNNMDEVFIAGEFTHVKMGKTYRNTKEILRYLQKVGFTHVEIPDELPEGEMVQEIISTDFATNIQKFLADFDKNSGEIGIVVPDPLAKAQLQSLSEQEHIHIMTIDEVQGIEFETVICVGLDRLLKSLSDNKKLREIQKEVRKDQVYVALTRAMNRLVVVGVHRTPPLRTLS